MRIVLMVIMTIMVFVSGEARSSEPEIPGNSIRIIVPFSAGGPTDVLARVVGKILGDKLGVTAYIENKPGASGIIGTEPVVRSPPELSLKVGDGGNREGGISWGCLTPPLLHRRSDMPCPKITSSS